MQAFRRGHVAESIQLFDLAERLSTNNNLTPFLWQRGISYYYVNDFDQARRQFRTDVQVNPTDVEGTKKNMNVILS
jgi:Flp pilus assembly protein TadD